VPPAGFEPSRPSKTVSYAGFQRVCNQIQPSVRPNSKSQPVSVIHRRWRAFSIWDLGTGFETTEPEAGAVMLDAQTFVYAYLGSGRWSKE
jgi:hypothetical protein